MSDTDSALKVTAGLPRVDEDDVEVLLDENSLTIRGEKRDESERTADGTTGTESFDEKFERVIPLTAEVGPEKAAAKFKKGVLEITLLRTGKAKNARKKILVKAQEGSARSIGGEAL